MIYISYYNSFLGKILLASKNNKLIGLWLDGQKHYLGNLTCELIEKNDEEIIVKTKLWLDKYFNGENPSIKELEINPEGSEFRKIVWRILCSIPYGEVTTYKKISEEVARIMKKDTMSSQAIGGAIAHNPISIIIPCHRVIGTDGSLTGYAGGIDKKVALLKLEGKEV